MKPLTIGAAARLCGKSKATISRAISSGKLSASRQGNKYAIDPAELARVFPWNTATVAQPAQRNDPQPPPATPSGPSPETLAAENQLLREMLDRERETIADLRERLTKTQALLADQRQPQPRRRWWPW